MSKINPRPRIVIVREDDRNDMEVGSLIIHTAEPQALTTGRVVAVGSLGRHTVDPGERAWWPRERGWPMGGGLLALELTDLVLAGEGTVTSCLVPLHEQRPR